MRAIIVDDERIVAEHIGHMLTEAGVDVVGIYTNPLEVFDAVRNLLPDVLFLDIEMPAMNGLELAERLITPGYDYEVVFVTGYNKYAVDAFGVNALDYLLKPINKEKLQKTLAKVQSRREFMDRYRHKNMSIRSKTDWQPDLGHPNQSLILDSSDQSVYSGNSVDQNNSVQSNRPKENIKVTLFGKLSVIADGRSEPIKWITAKCAELFAYLIIHKEEREISKWRLLEDIWPENNTEKGYINLRSTISRTNKSLRDYDAGIVIICSENFYRLEAFDAVLEIDCFELEKLVLSGVKITPENVVDVEMVVFNYVRMLLEDLDSDWARVPREICHRNFTEVARGLLRYYDRIGAEPLKSFRLVELILRHDPYEEEARMNALRLHWRMGGNKKLDSYYREYEHFLMTDLGIGVDASMKKVYRELRKTRSRGDS